MSGLGVPRCCERFGWMMSLEVTGRDEVSRPTYCCFTGMIGTGYGM